MSERNGAMIEIPTQLYNEAPPVVDGGHHLGQAIEVPMLAQAKPPADSRLSMQDISKSVCSVCHNTRWIKSFTPWGCPTSAPCPHCS